MEIENELNTNLQFESLEERLKGARNDLENWYGRDLERKDGSGSQDRRHEDRKEHLQDTISDLEKRIRNLK